MYTIRGPVTLDHVGDEFVTLVKEALEALNQGQTTYAKEALAPQLGYPGFEKVSVCVGPPAFRGELFSIHLYYHEYGKRREVGLIGIVKQD